MPLTHPPQPCSTLTIGATVRIPNYRDKKLKAASCDVAKRGCGKREAATPFRHITCACNVGFEPRTIVAHRSLRTPATTPALLTSRYSFSLVYNP